MVSIQMAGMVVIIVRSLMVAIVTYLAVLEDPEIDVMVQIIMAVMAGAAAAS